MSDQPQLPPPEPTPEPAVASPNPARRNPVPWFYALGFVILAVAIFYLWQNPSVPTENRAEASALQAAERRVGDIDTRLTRLEQRPVPAPAPDLGKLTARIDSLEGRVGEQTQLGSRMDTLSGRIESLSARDQTGLDANKQQLDTLASRVAALESNAGSLAAVTKRLNRIAKLQEASLALASGRPVGDLPDAPEALGRFAHSGPPTEAQLRIRFPIAEQAALAAKQPDTSEAPFIDRMWERAQGLVTIRKGDEVVVGNPSAVTLSQAQAALEAGDLSGAVQAVSSLTGPPAQAMADWLADARALLNARAALADLAEKA